MEIILTALIAIYFISVIIYNSKFAQELLENYNSIFISEFWVVFLLFIGGFIPIFNTIFAIKILKEVFKDIGNN